MGSKQACPMCPPCAQSPDGAGPASAWSTGSVPSLHAARGHVPGQCCGAAPEQGCCTRAGPIASSPVPPSSPDPCHNGGSCSDGVGTFFCECLAGFRGPKCEEDINECASNPCKNGANCTDCVNSYTCTCPSGFSGIHCENNTPDCTERYSPARLLPRVQPLSGLEQEAEVLALPRSPGPVCGGFGVEHNQR